MPLTNNSEELKNSLKTEEKIFNFKINSNKEYPDEEMLEDDEAIEDEELMDEEDEEELEEEERLFQAAQLNMDIASTNLSIADEVQAIKRNLLFLNHQVKFKMFYI